MWAALKANPAASLSAVAKLAKVSRSTVVNARDLARKPRETSSALAKQTERRQRAQQFLREQLARGPQRVSDIEQAAEKQHIDAHTLEAARAALGVTPSRANAGGGSSLSVQWALPAGAR
jgi:transposase